MKGRQIISFVDHIEMAMSPKFRQHVADVTAGMQVCRYDGERLAESESWDGCEHPAGCPHS